MHLLYQILIDPFVQMAHAPDLLVQTLWDGLVAGVLYSLIALGFVLIYKASGVFNFAQGSMVLLAGLALVRSLDFLVAKGFPWWAAVIVALLFAGTIMAITAAAMSIFCNDTKPCANLKSIAPRGSSNSSAIMTLGSPPNISSPKPMRK